MSDDAVREIKRELSDPIRLCEQLGLLQDRRSFQRQAGGLLIRCPVHDDRTPSCSVQNKGGAVVWKCHACDAAGDALTLVAHVYGLTMEGDDFRQVLVVAAELAGLHSVADEIKKTAELRERPRPVARPEPSVAVDRDYPAESEVAALWAASQLLGDEDATWMAARGFDADRIGDAARRIPIGAPLPSWASYQGKPWTETGHRVIVPVYDAAGVMRSVRAVRVTPGESPKRLPPAGHKAAALLMACEIALAMLRGTYEPKHLLVVEGEPDFLSVVSVPSRHVYARIGIISGSWTPELAAKVPIGTRVIIATHGDHAGEKYAAAIIPTLTTQEILRWRPNHNDGSGTDINDRLRAKTLPADPEDEARPIERPKIPRMADAFRAASKLLRAGPQPNPLRTGFDELDAGLRRLGPREFTMLAADSGIGKSTIATQIALHVGMSGHGVVYFNLEMSEEMYGLRTASNYVQIATQRAASHQLTPGEYSQLTHGLDFLAEPAKRIALGNRRDHRTIAAIKKFCEESARVLSSEGTPLKLIVVDHILQVLAGVKNDKDAEGKARSDLLKDLCEAHNAHVLALVHVTREGSKSGSMPTKNQLASSAWFDRDPDNILVFHQSRKADGTFSTDPATLSCQKARWGEPFAVELEYRKGFFYPWSLEPRAAAAPSSSTGAA